MDLSHPRILVSSFVRVDPIDHLRRRFRLDETWKKVNTHPRKRSGKEEIDPACWILVTKYSILRGGRLSFVGSIFMRNHGRGRWLCGHKWVMDDVTISSLSRMDVTISHLRRHGYELTNGPNKLSCLSVCLSDLSLARPAGIAFVQLTIDSINCIPCGGELVRI